MRTVPDRTAHKVLGRVRDTTQAAERPGIAMGRALPPLGLQWQEEGAVTGTQREGL